MKPLRSLFCCVALGACALAQSSLQTGGLNKSAEKPTTKPTGDLPWAIEGHAFTLTEINEYRVALLGQVVNLKLAPVRAEKDADGKGFDVFVADAKSAGRRLSNYAFVYFPPEGATKLNTFLKTSRGELSFYVKVDAERLTAVGRSRNIDSFKNTFAYVW